MFYPVTDAAMDTGSYEQFAKGYFLYAKSMAWFWDAYLPDVELRAEPYASPLRASDEQLAGLPPALVMVDEADVLRDEGEAYAAQLRAAGVPVTTVRYDGITHDFTMLTRAQRAPRSRRPSRCCATRCGAPDVDSGDPRRSHTPRSQEAKMIAKSVRDAMTEDLRSIAASASAVDAAQRMREGDVGSLPVVENERLVGMITDRDITTRVVAESADPRTTSVEDIYSRDVVTVEPDTSLDEALRLMARHQVRRVPVVENGKLVGIVAQADIALKGSGGEISTLVEAVSEPSAGDRR